jgi:hypothetical protein
VSRAAPWRILGVRQRIFARIGCSTAETVANWLRGVDGIPGTKLTIRFAALTAMATPVMPSRSIRSDDLQIRRWGGRNTPRDDGSSVGLRLGGGGRVGCACRGNSGAHDTPPASGHRGHEMAVDLCRSRRRVSRRPRVHPCSRPPRCPTTNAWDGIGERPAVGQSATASPVVLREPLELSKTAGGVHASLTPFASRSLECSPRGLLSRWLRAVETRRRVPLRVAARAECHPGCAKHRREPRAYRQERPRTARGLARRIY